MIRAPYGFPIAFCLCTGALVITLMAASPPAGIGPTDASDLAIRPHAGAQLPLATRLVDERGSVVRLREYFIRSPVILVLEYLRCTALCGVTLRNLLEALNGLPLDVGRDYKLVAISIDPRDKPEDAVAAKAKYVNLLDHGEIEAGVHFLTAAFPAEVREIADTVGFPYRYDALLDAYIHPSGFVIAAPDGVISRYVEGVAISSRDLIGALADAENSKPQDPLTRLLLLCHVRGAQLNGLAVPVLTAFAVAEFAAGLTVFVIFAVIWRHRA